MDKDLSEQQFVLARELYSDNGHVKTITIHLPSQQNPVTYEVQLQPTQLLRSGHGYRFITRADGEEFNDLPRKTAIEREVCQVIAIAIMEIELVNILSAGYLDCDRHGSQLRAVTEAGKIKLGLYDFGEMSLTKPEEIEIKQLAKLISDILTRLRPGSHFNEAMMKLLSEHITLASHAKEPTSYLMRIRKAILALQDFQKVLTMDDMVAILKKVKDHPAIHPMISKAIQDNIARFYFNNVVATVSNWMSTISTSIHSLFAANKAISTRVTQTYLSASSSQAKPPM